MRTCGSLSLFGCDQEAVISSLRRELPDALACVSPSVNGWVQLYLAGLDGSETSFSAMQVCATKLAADLRVPCVAIPFSSLCDEIWVVMPTSQFITIDFHRSGSLDWLATIRQALLSLEQLIPGINMENALIHLDSCPITFVSQVEQRRLPFNLFVASALGIPDIAECYFTIQSKMEEPWEEGSLPWHRYVWLGKADP